MSACYDLIPCYFIPLKKLLQVHPPLIESAWIDQEPGLQPHNVLEMYSTFSCDSFRIVSIYNCYLSCLRTLDPINEEY